MLLEQLMDSGAVATGLDPLKIRRRNVILASDMPFATPTGEKICSGDFPRLLTEAVLRSGYVEACVARDEDRDRGMLRGVGLALYVEPCGTGWESAAVSLGEGGRIIASTGSTNQGQGRQTAAKQIVCSQLKVPPSSVEIRHGDTSTIEWGIGALASRSTAIGGSALTSASREFLDRARKAAANHLSVEPEALFHSVTGFSVRGEPNRCVTWSKLAECALAVSIVYEPKGEAWSSGCCVACVEVDAELGTVVVQRLTIVDDAGSVINPMLVEGQLIGGAAQGLGEALMERLVYDEDGQLLTGSLMDYAVPRAGDMPPICISSAPNPTPMNLLGAKGVGEAGCIGVPAAIANAVLDALRPLGDIDLELPLTAEKIWRAIRNAHSATKE